MGIFDNSSIVSITAGTFNKKFPPLCSMEPAVTSWLFEDITLIILLGDKPYASIIFASIIISIISSRSPPISTSSTPVRLSSSSFNSLADLTRLE